MKASEVENITYNNEENGEIKIYLEHSPTDDIPNHYNIKPSLLDLRFANNCAHHLSRISTLVIKE